MQSLRKLQFENSQLRSELKAQKAVCQKCREDLELSESQKGAAEEKNRMLQNMLDSKDKRISELLKMKEDLELRLHCVVETQQTNAQIMTKFENSESVEELPRGATLPQLNAREVVEAFDKWDGMEDITNTFQDILDAEQSSAQWFPGCPWTSQWKFIITVYISAHLTLRDYVTEFMEVYFPEIIKQCMDVGCYANVVCINVEEAEHLFKKEKILSVCCDAIEKADIFVSVIGTSTNELVKTEIEHGFLNNPFSRFSVFLLLPTDAKSDCSESVLKLKNRIKKVQSPKKKIMECQGAVGNSLLSLRDYLQQLLISEFDVIIPTKYHGSFDSDPEVYCNKISLLEDMRIEWEQSEILKSIADDVPPSLIGSDEQLSALDAYINEEGPVAPYLITGNPGQGKSSLIVKWFSHLVLLHQTSIIPIFHFVKSLCSSTADPMAIFRRFILKMMYHCKDTSSVPTNPLHLQDAFEAYMQKFSTHVNSRSMKAVFVIDGADLVTDCDPYLNWILKPLPKNIRVVLTASEENYPDHWRALPSPSMPTPTTSDLQDVIKLTQSAIKFSVLNDEQISLLAIQAPPQPLWCVLAVKHIARVSSCSSLSLDELVDSLEDHVDVPELVKHIIGDHEHRNESLAVYFEKVLQLLYYSRNGLLLLEISQILNMPKSVLAVVVYELMQSSLILSVGGIIYIAHDQILEGVQMKYNTSPTIDYMLEWSMLLIKFFSESSCFMSRRAEELPWLLKRADKVDMLFTTVLDIDMFIHVCCSGHGGEMLKYWHYLQPHVSNMAYEYCKVLLEIEEGKNHPLVYVAHLFGTVGRLLGNLGFIEEGLYALEHGLELWESQYDPDGVEVAYAMCELAQLYLRQGKPNTAEGFYNQALQMLENTVGEDSLLLLKVLDPLSAIYNAMGNDQLLQVVMTRVHALNDKQNSSESASAVLASRFFELEEVSESCTDSVLLIKSLNELAVIHAVYGDMDFAQETFLRCLDVAETTFGEADKIALAPLKNLGTFYMQNGSVDLAAVLLKQAYDIVKANGSDLVTQLADIIERLSLLYRDQEQLDLAEPLQLELLDITEKEYGPCDLRVAKVFNNLAVIYSLKHEFVKAIPVYDRAVEIYVQMLGQDHHLVLDAKQNKRYAESMLLFK